MQKFVNAFHFDKFQTLNICGTICSIFAFFIIKKITASVMPVLRRCISEVSMIVFRATHSGERAWREEYLK